MTAEQNNNIREYLKAKKLPLELLIEIEDHFISQIHEFQKENMEFQPAFEKTKEIWKDELTLSWDGSCDLEDKCDLLRNYRKTKRNTLIKQTLKYGGLVAGVVFILFFLLPYPIKKWYLLITYLGFAIAPLALFIYNWKDYKLLRKYDFQVSYYQIGLFSTGALWYNTFQISQYIWERKTTFDFINHPWKSIMIICIISIVYIVSTGTIICHKKLLKTIKNLKHHLLA